MTTSTNEKDKLGRGSRTFHSIRSEATRPVSRVTNPDARRAAAAARSRTAAAAAILAWEKRYAFAARRASGGDASGVQTIALILDDSGVGTLLFLAPPAPAPASVPVGFFKAQRGALNLKVFTKGSRVRFCIRLTGAVNVGPGGSNLQPLKQKNG